MKYPIEQEPATNKDKLLTVSKLLIELGVPVRLKGYDYIRQAVLSFIECPRRTMELYALVGQKAGVSPRNVERGIRVAVETSFLRMDLDTQYRYFGNTISADKGKPTNSEFIAVLADRLLLRAAV